MRLVILISILLLFASCRSHKEVLTDSVGVTCTASQSHSISDSASLMIGQLRSFADIDVSDLAIGFMRPDSIHPDIRAVPVSLSAGRVRISRHTDAAVVKVAESEVTKTDSALTTTSFSTQRHTTAESRASPCILPLASIAIIIASLAFTVAFVLRARK